MSETLEWIDEHTYQGQPDWRQPEGEPSSRSLSLVEITAFTARDSQKVILRSVVAQDVTDLLIDRRRMQERIRELESTLGQQR